MNISWITKKVVPGDGGAEEGGVKVNLIRKKRLCRVKGGGAVIFMFVKKVHQKIYKYASYLPSKCFSNLLLGLQVKPKLQIVTFFPDTNHARGSIGGTFTANVSLVPPVWTKIYTHCKNVKNFTVSDWYCR